MFLSPEGKNQCELSPGRVVQSGAAGTRVAGERKG